MSSTTGNRDYWITSVLQIVKINEQLEYVQISEYNTIMNTIQETYQTAHASS